jgi:hypothetical protein
LQTAVGQHLHGGGGDLLAEVRHTAVMLWTSQDRFEGMGEEHDKEFCSLLNAAIRKDDQIMAPSVAVLCRGINDKICVKDCLGDLSDPFPPEGITYRGGGFDDAYRDFFTVGKQYRVPGFLATSFVEGKAMEFLRAAEAYEHQPVLWTVHVDPAGADDATKRCKHANLIKYSMVPGEQEYLFSAYSIFTVRSVEWGVDRAHHRIHLDAASNNKSDAEGGDGRWATPVGSEELPLAPYY